MKYQTIKYLVFLSSLFLLEACGSKNDPVPATTANALADFCSQTNNTFGTLSVLRAKTRTTVGTDTDVEEVMGTIATFEDNSGYLDGGVVRMNNQTLDKETDNTYSKELNSVSGNISWKVSGKGVVPMLDINTNKELPVAIDITSALPRNKIDKSKDLVIKLLAAVKADYVVAMIADLGDEIQPCQNNPSYGIILPLASGSQGFTFKAADLAKVRDTNGYYITIIATNYTTTTVSGKKILCSNISTFTHAALY